MAEIILSKSGKVPASSDIRAEYIPAVGEKLMLVDFLGHAAFSESSVVCLCWDEGGAAEEVIWNTKGDAKDERLFLDLPVGDGVKKIELILDNSTAGDIVLSGRVVLVSI